MRRLVILISMVGFMLSASSVRADTIAEVFKKVKDSVVVIGTTSTEGPSVPGGAATSVGGLGSGVLIDRLGLVLTAAHVVQVAEDIQVEFTNGEIISAKVQSSVPAADLALLRLDHPPRDGVAARLGDSGNVEVGDQIFIVGAPLGISHTLTVGHISARRITDNLFGGMLNAEMFQTDAAINVGNSGGPMFSMAGEVIGIVSHMISQSGGYEGLGFVMTSNLANELLIKRRGIWSGLEGYTLSGELAGIFNLPQNRAVLVQRVAKGSPASRMGLLPGFLPAVIDGEPVLLGGDIILEVNGIKYSEPDALQRIRAYVSSLLAGEELKMTVLRRGKRIDLVAKPKPF